MARSSASKLARVAHRGLQSTRIARTSLAASPVAVQYAPSAAPASVFTARRSVSTTPHHFQSITPDAKAPKNAEATPVTKTPADISDGEYHSVADEYLDKLLLRLEQLQDEQEEVDVEFSAGVLTLNLGPEIGTYVINKQPPNKQIWLSSPKTGPKRYDYVVFGEGQHEKQDTARGDWVYLRDGSTLGDLLKAELGIDSGLADTDIGS
ncbi:Frataxin-like domain-containing protein [Dichotomopilus funicola]|uniref:ferroxidase n=1 Tax=Dichotomopilus funicola TaxID=1934379 RepID=A0AAN6UZZ9_9PEZI|nr:Frataxin-like domain-containing protein [Dichotomopilus funicola]